MCKYKLVEKTTRRLRREYKNLRSAANMNDLQDIRNLNPQGEIESVTAQGGQDGQNGQNMHGQPGNNNIIYMTNDKDRGIIDYTVLTPQATNPGIVRMKCKLLISRLNQ